MDVDPAGPEPSHAELAFACRSIRLGSRLHDRLDRKDGISQQDSDTAGDAIRQLHLEGLLAFLEDIPLVRRDQPFSVTRC